jgi:hypothetical protein
MRRPFRLAGKCCFKLITSPHNNDDDNNTVDDDER